MAKRATRVSTMLSRHDRLFFLSLLPYASLLLAVLILLVVVFVYESYPILVREGLSFITSSLWSPSTKPSEAFYGVLAALYGTAVTSIIAIAIALPVSVSMTIFVNEILPHRLRPVFSTIVDLMAGLPTVVYGLWGLTILAPLLRDYVMKPLHEYLGFIPLFSCNPLSGYSLLTAGVILAVMVTPYSFALMNEAYQSIPMIYREAVYSLGARLYQAAWINISMIRPAVIGAILLGLGRAASETIAVTLVIGNTPTVSACLFSSGYTISSLIATQYGEAYLYPYMINALYGAGLILLIVGLVLNTIGISLVSKWRERIRGS